MKLIDFGLAGLLRPNDGDALHTPCGTPMYCPPEIFSFTRDYEGKPVDMWALGVNLYSMLHGSLPFGEYAQTVEEVSDLVQECHIEVAAELSEGARDLILRLLQADPSDRLTIEQCCQHAWVSDEGLYMPFRTMEVPKNWNWINPNDVTSQPEFRNRLLKSGTDPDKAFSDMQRGLATSATATFKLLKRAMEAAGPALPSSPRHLRRRSISKMPPLDKGGKQGVSFSDRVKGGLRRHSGGSFSRSSPRNVLGGIRDSLTKAGFSAEQSLDESRGRKSKLKGLYLALVKIPGLEMRRPSTYVFACELSEKRLSFTAELVKKFGKLTVSLKRTQGDDMVLFASIFTDILASVTSRSTPSSSSRSSPRIEWAAVSPRSGEADSASIL